jgi:hypothetical protein
MAGAPSTRPFVNTDRTFLRSADWIFLTSLNDQFEWGSATVLEAVKGRAPARAASGFIP